MFTASTRCMAWRAGSIYAVPNAAQSCSRVAEIGRSSLEILDRSLKLHDFPPGFMLGVGTAAYQIEGAYNEGALEQSVWKAFVKNQTRVPEMWLAFRYPIHCEA